MDVSTLNPIRVMIVDDHASMRWGLRKLVESQKPAFEVVGEASNRGETLAIARRAHPDIILLDIDLGDDNGLDLLPELLKEVRAHVIILTGLRDPDAHNRAILCGARGVVLKEEPAEVIIEAIKKVHRGELWLDGAAIGRAFSELLRRNETKKTDPEAAKIASLTAREREIISVVVSEGYSTNKKVAERLHLSEHTLRNHLTSIYSKLDVENRLELFMYALTHGLAKPRSG